MSLTLDPQTEQRIQRELERGRYGDPSEVINHAMDLLASDGSWSDAEKKDLDQRLAQSIADVEQGNTYSPEEARAILAERRAARAR